MDCEDIHDILSAMLDGEASEGEASTAARHIAGCEACRIYCDGLVADRLALRAWPDELPSRHRAPASMPASAVARAARALVAAGIPFALGLSLGLTLARGRAQRVAEAPPRPTFFEESRFVVPDRNEIRLEAWLTRANPAAIRVGDVRR